MKLEMRNVITLYDNEIQKDFATLKLMILRAQMNPHFIFNTIHAIEYLILSNKNRLAYDYLIKFSKLLRIVMNSTETIMTKLNDEVEFIKLYLSMEKIRYGDKFDFIINYPPDLDEKGIIIPSMIIQPHVENAIMHGLINKEEHGVVSVSFRIIAGKLEITIDDNGVGRKKAQEISEKKKLDISNKIAQKNIFTRLVKLGGVKKNDYTIIDKFDNNGDPIGTKVIIKIKIN